MIVPSDMVRALATIEAAAVMEVATQFAEATREELGWTSEEFVPIVTDLSALAKRAVETKKSLYLWNSV